MNFVKIENRQFRIVIFSSKELLSFKLKNKFLSFFKYDSKSNHLPNRCSSGCAKFYKQYLIIYLPQNFPDPLNVYNLNSKPLPIFVSFPFTVEWVRSVFSPLNNGPSATVRFHVAPNFEPVTLLWRNSVDTRIVNAR